MTHEKRLAIISLINKHKRANTSSKEAATKALVKEGIYTKDKRLSPHYGGAVKKTARIA